MALTREQVNRRIQIAKSQGWDDAKIRRNLQVTLAKEGGLVQSAPTPAQQPKKSPGLIAQLAPILGSVGGAVVGGVTAGPVGALAGGAAGGAAGERYRQKASGEEANWGNVAKEGAFGALGNLGGAIKAVRGVSTLAKGAKAADALYDAGQLAKVGKTIKGAGLIEGGARAAGKAVKGVGESLATKALRATPKQLSGFAAKHGEDIVPVLQREGLVGRSPDAIRASIEPIQKQFGDMIAKTKIKVNPKQVEQAFMQQMKPLLDSTDPDDARVAQRIMGNMKNVLASVKKDPSVSNLNKLRHAYDSKVNYKLAEQDLLRYTEKKTVADALRSTVQSTVDQSGLTGPMGENLKQLGLRLNKLYDVSKIAETQAHLGRGSLPAGLLQLLSVGGGVGVGGPAGGLVGLAAQQAINSPTGMRVGSQLLSQAGEKIANAGSKVGAIAGKVGPSVGNAARAGAGSMAGRAVFGGDQAQGQEAPQGMDLLDQYLTPDEGMDSLGQAPQQGAQYDPNTIVQMLQQDLAATGGRNFSKIQTLAKFMQEAAGGTGTKQSKLSDTAIQNVTDIQTAMSDLDGLRTALTGSTGVDIPGIGYRVNAPTTQTKITRSEVDRVRQVVGKALEGGVLRKEDEEKYKRILPTVNDSMEVAQAKIDRLMAALENKLTTFTNLQNSRGSGQFSTDPYQQMVSGLNNTLSGY